MGLEFTLFFPIINRLFFIKNTMVNPSIKGRKSKDVHQNQNQNVHIRARADAESTISLFVLIGLVPFSFI